MTLHVAAAVVAVFVASGVLSLALAVSAHRNRDRPAAREFRNFAGAGGAWALLELAAMVAPSDGAALLVEAVGEAVAIAVVVTFLVFVFEYAQSPRFSGPTARRGLYALVPAYWLLFVVPVSPTAPVREVASFHGLLLVQREFGAVFGWWTALTFVFVFAAWWNLLRLVFDSTNVYRKQSAVVLLSSLLVAATAVLSIAGVLPEGLQFAVAVRAVEAALIWVAVFRFDFLSVMPLARDALVDAIEEPVVVVDEADAVVYANAAARDLSSSVRRGAAIDDALPGLAAALSADEEYRAVVDGERRTFSPATTPLLDHYDAVRGRVLLLRDVTARERRERRLEEFASVVSHDLRNPLTVADGYVRDAHERGDADLEPAVRALERMDEMIDELLALAREGYDADDAAPVDLSRAAEAAWRTVDTGGATLDVDDGPPVVADDHQLREILENLFRNSVEHGSTSSRTESGDAVEHGSTSSRTESDDPVEHNDGPVAVRVERTAEGFAVADDGVGIPPDERDRVFEGGYTTARDGTGVGLHVVERFAEAHGWDVSVTESADGGARFEFATGDTAPEAGEPGPEAVR
jgi:signal transduction histidine kinase